MKLARPKRPPRDAEAEDQQDRQDAAIDLTHVLREEQATAADRVAPDRARGRPVLDGRIGGAVEVGEYEHQEVGRMQGAEPCGRKTDLRPVGIGGEQRRHDDGNDGDRDRRRGACRER
jgi:hypothetical protein